MKNCTQCRYEKNGECRRYPATVQAITVIDPSTHATKNYIHVMLPPATDNFYCGEFTIKNNIISFKPVL